MFVSKMPPFLCVVCLCQASRTPRRPRRSCSMKHAQRLSLGTVALHLFSALLSLEGMTTAAMVHDAAHPATGNGGQDDQGVVRRVRRGAVEDGWKQVEVAPREPLAAWPSGTEDCILLFGAFCNGNMGDVMQPISMEHLLASVVPPEQCFYYAHPRGEDLSMGYSIGKFFGGNDSKVAHLSRDDAWKVNRFKAFVIGGGGIFSAEHVPLFLDDFAEAVTAPIAVMGVGANHHAKKFRTLLYKAAFVSGRDKTATERFATILGDAATPVVRPGDVQLVRDPVLCDIALTDTNGTCWGQSLGDYHQPLCFVLPSATNAHTVEMHRHLRARVARKGDRFINVFPKHQEELAQFQYPGRVEEILDPTEYAERLCWCKAIISFRLHGAILGLHMGVPTFGAFHNDTDNKVPELMIDTMALPDQFFLVDGNINREAVDRRVETVRRLYENEGRRGDIHGRLSVLHEEFQVQARRMLDVVGVPRPKEGRFRSRKTADFGSTYVLAMSYLLAIVGLAFMPSTAALGGGRGNYQKPWETADDADGDGMPSSSSKGQARTDNPYRVQEEADKCRGRSPERGFLPKRWMALAPETPPSRTCLRRPGDDAPDNEDTPAASVLVFALNFTLWIALAVAFGSHGKSYLRDTHDPIGLLALQGLAGSLVLFALGRVGVMGAPGAPGPNHPSSKDHGLRGLMTRVLLQHEPTVASRREALVAVLHSGQALFTNFSVFVGGVAVTNALKAMEPVAAAVASYFLLGKRTTTDSGAALAIIVAGILVLTSGGTGGVGGHSDTGGATDNDGRGGSSFVTGSSINNSRILASGAVSMAAVSCNALRNVVIKEGDPIPPHRTLFACSVAAGAIGVTLKLLRLMFRCMDEILLGGENGSIRAQQYGSWVTLEGINAALCFVGYNLASLNLLTRLSPVGHAVGNSFKRVVIFGSGIVLLREEMTARQLVGTAVALIGVGVYNVVVRRH